MVKWLTENYRGLAQMANMISEWLKISGMEEQDIINIIKDHLKSLIIKNFDPKQADTIFQEGSVCECFTISNRTKETPDWLLKMIKHPEWRSLFYQLAETYRNCLLLNFAIQVGVVIFYLTVIQRISDEGHQNEIASLATASTFYPVFNKVLKESLMKMFKMDEISIVLALGEFKVCCYSIVCSN